MPQTPKDPSVMTLEELGREMRLREDLHQHLAAKAEFNLRQMRAQIEATEAQKAAAKAEEIAANATVEGAKIARVNALLMFFSVIVALVAALASAFSAYFAYLSVVHPIFGDGPG